MQLTIHTDQRGASKPRRQAISAGIVHTTERSEADELAALTGAGGSVHTFIARNGDVYRMVDFDRAAAHAGYGRRESGAWADWDDISVGWSFGHRAGGKLAPGMHAHGNKHVPAADDRTAESSDSPPTMHRRSKR